MNPPIAELTRDKMESILGPIARYTRFVQSTKVMLAIFAVILTAIILFYPLLKRDTSARIPIISSKGPASPTKMLNARYHGLDKDNQPYNITAKTAIQMDEDTVDLDHLNADITLKSNAWLSVTAKTGVFKMKAKELELKGSIELFNDEGYEFRTEQMHVDVGRKTATTYLEVTGQGPLGKLKAYGGAHVDGITKVTTFEGPVFVTVFPSQEDKKPQKTGKK